MTPETSVIRSEPHVEIGAIIARDAAVIVNRWCERVLAEQVSSARVHLEALRNQVGPLLQAMGEGLLQAGDGDPLDHRNVALEHGEQRWDSGWSITDVVRDYQILQLVIIEHLENTLERPLRYREIMAVGVFIDDAISASIAAYVANRDQHMREIERERATLLAEMDRRKDDFLALVVHELRSPLSPIVNAARILELIVPKADTDARTTARVIRRQAKQLARLLDDLSDLTRIAQGRLELRKSIVDVADVIDQAVQTCQPLLEERSHRLTLRMPQRSLAVDADPARLIQVVVNLLNNAAKYTPLGGEVTLTAQREGDRVVIRVRDTGIGIDPAMIPRIFDMYVRAARWDDESPDGLGIGLALVSELVALHGGRIECLSEGRGKGAEFVVSLPVARGTYVAAVTPPAAMPVGARKLLIVEDDTDARESLSTLLRLMGHEVDSVANAAAGIERLLKDDYDAGLIDIGLPDLNGYELAEIVRRERGRGVLLIALTGYGRPADATRALESGFDAHLVKPLDTDALGRVLASARAAR